MKKFIKKISSKITTEAIESIVAVLGASTIVQFIPAIEHYMQIVIEIGLTTAIAIALWFIESFIVWTIRMVCTGIKYKHSQELLKDRNGDGKVKLCEVIENAKEIIANKDLNKQIDKVIDKVEEVVKLEVNNSEVDIKQVDNKAVKIAVENKIDLVAEKIAEEEKKIIEEVKNEVEEIKADLPEEEKQIVDNKPVEEVVSKEESKPVSTPVEEVKQVAKQEVKKGTTLSKQPWEGVK